MLRREGIIIENYANIEEEGKIKKLEMLKISKYKMFLFILANILFLGIPLLLSKWSLRFRRWSHYSFIRNNAHLERATHLLIHGGGESNELMIKEQPPKTRK